MAEGVTHISCHHTRIRSGGQEKIKQTNKHEQSLGLTKEQKESYATLWIPDSIYGLTLAWFTSENSTKQLECRHLDSSSSLDPILSATVSGVQCWLPLSVVPRQLSLLSRRQLSAVQSPCRPVANCLSAPLSSQLSFASPYHFRIRRDFMSKNPLSGFAPKQTKESSALAAHPHSATKHKTVRMGFFIFNVCFYRGSREGVPEGEFPWGSSHEGVVNMLSCIIIECELEFQLCYIYVWFFRLLSSSLLLLVVIQRFNRCILRPSSDVPCLSGHRNDSTYAQINKGHMKKVEGWSGRNFVLQQTTIWGQQFKNLRTKYCISSHVSRIQPFYCVPFSTNTLAKGMKPLIYVAMG